MRTDPQTYKNDKSRCINVIQRLLIWCGEGDLNPHEIAPASTSSYSKLPLSRLFNELRARFACCWIGSCTIVVTITSHHYTFSGVRLPAPSLLPFGLSVSYEVTCAAACL